MTTISTTDVVNFTTTNEATINSNFSNVKNVVNGNLDSGNLAAMSAEGNRLPLSKFAVGAEGHYLQTVAGVTAWASGPASAVMPTGAMILNTVAAVPTGWLLCDGTAVSRTTYADLFAVLGTAYGPGDGATTFNLPDTRGRTAIGKGTHLDVDALSDNDGETESSRSPTNTHSHSFTTVDAQQGALPDFGALQTTQAATTTLPYLTLTYIIKT